MILLVKMRYFFKLLTFITPLSLLHRFLRTLKMLEVIECTNPWAVSFRFSGQSTATKSVLEVSEVSKKIYVESLNPYHDDISIG